jgi:hypothetical protein
MVLSKESNPKHLLKNDETECMENDFTFYKSGDGQGNHPKRKISQARGGGFKDFYFF